MSRQIEDLLPERPEARLQIYAWSTPDIPKYAGCLKVGQTTQDVNARIKQSHGQAKFKYKLEVHEPADRPDGSYFRDSAVRDRLKAKGLENVELEWMRCTADDVRTAIHELRTGKNAAGNHHETFQMRAEQADAVAKTAAYYESIWAEDKDAVPRFLWNAKMRFGKTFAAYQLAKRLGAKRVLVVTFKPAVEDAWETDLNSHVDFEGWQYLSKSSGGDPMKANKKRPLVYFGSFQDLLGKKDGRIKAKNEWLHWVNWDLVIFDEYHFGAWRDNAKELFEGEEAEVAKKELEGEYANVLDDFRESLDALSGAESDFLPISTRAYLYLSGTPFKALATGEFIEEQIFNWTYTDEQR
ncbi:MAG: restriction endonuclease, partial [Actinobacteria bacterium]|nr:restriction endonuclease [Actinomycetota bacterium]